MQTATLNRLAETVRAYFSPAYEDRHYYHQFPKLMDAVRTIESRLASEPEPKPIRDLIAEIRYYDNSTAEWNDRKARLLDYACNILRSKEHVAG